MVKIRKLYPHVEAAMGYVDGVLSGRISSCRFIKLACQRHLDDLKKAEEPDYPFYFDPAKAERVCRFVEMMIHTKGKWQRQPLILEPWQLFSIVVPWGWMRRSNHKRRFTEIYEEEPRKNAKSTKLAALGNYMLTADGEPGAEVYCGATSEKQAWEVFKPARLMALWNDEYRDAFSIHVGAKNLAILDGGSKFEPVIGNPGDGSSPSYAIIDEYHEHKTPDQYDTMKTGMGAREQPMLHIITTAGTDISGPCYAKRQEAIKVLEGVLENDALFVLIYALDESDDWKDFAVWAKTNPNLGVSIFEDYLRQVHAETLASAEKQNINLCKQGANTGAAVPRWRWGLLFKPPGKVLF